MKVIVATLNQPKIDAVASVFALTFPDEQIEIESLAVDSGVSSHPLSAEESIKGAVNRSERASETIIGVDYYVGIEGGLFRLGNRAWEIGWISIRTKNGETSTGLSSGIELRGKILKEVLSGSELSKVLEDEFDIESQGTKTGFYGLATDDRVTRQTAYEQGITFALAPLLHPELFKD
jgi:inosine/xanthosine triphosphatase